MTSRETPGPMDDEAYVALLTSRLDATSTTWDVVVDPGGFWVHADPAAATHPTQGWKLHVSAGLASAIDVLRQALDVLVADPASFKIARSPAHLDALNAGAAGLSQIGKFVTVYPHDDAQAVRLASALHDATVGMRGPRVPSDRPLARGSLVHYRYGAFSGRVAQLPSGAIQDVIVGPDGTLDEDARTVTPPDWVVDPFLAAAPARESAEASTVIGGRFVLMGTMVQSARGAVYLAVDMDGPARCVVKQARRDSLLSWQGTDACDRLRDEARSLAALGDGPWPTLLALVEQEGDLFLAETEIVGDRLARRIEEAGGRGRHLGDATVARWGAALARAVAQVHRCGLVVRDLKATNVIITDEGEPRLIDLECVEIGADISSGTLASRGSASPEQLAQQPPSPADDVYGLGVLLWSMTTGAEPGAAPDPADLTTRAIRLLHPGVGEPLVEIVERCLAPRAADRFPDATAIATALDAAALAADASAPLDATTSATASATTAAAVDPAAATTAAATGEAPASAGRAEVVPAPAPAVAEWHAQAAAIGEALLRRARRVPAGGLTWGRPTGPAIIDVGDGDAGVVLALSGLHAHAPSEALTEALVSGTAHLRVAPRLSSPPLAGLYAGEAGVAAALLAAGHALGDDDLVAAAVAHGDAVAALALDTTDLIHGAAGRARVHLWLHEATGEAACRRDAIVAGDHLLATAVSVAGGGLAWTMPDGFDRLSGRRHLGYAHGAAGIGDVLLDLYEATGQERFLTAATRVAGWLACEAVPALDGDTGRTWPSIHGEPDAMIAWCNGATGVAAFLRHALRLGALPARSDRDVDVDVDELIRGAVRAVGLGTRAVGPGQCHGLAGSVELLLDVDRDDADTHPDARHHADEIGRLLATFVEPASFVDDPLAASAASSRPPSPLTARLTLGSGYLEGLAGILAATLRLADPTRRNLLGGPWWAAERR